MIEERIEQDGFYVDPETGEVLGVVEQVPEQDAEALAMWLGEALTRAKADLEGIRAVRESWLHRIEDIYGPQERAAVARVDWLQSGNPGWVALLRDYAAQKLAGAKTKTLKLGLLKLAFRSSRESVEVVDEQAAVEWVKDIAPAAVKQSLLKSAIPPHLRESLPADSGMVFHPAGETETFEVG